jgi:hypothetical protein
MPLGAITELSITTTACPARSSAMARPIASWLRVRSILQPAEMTGAMGRQLRHARLRPLAKFVPS